MTGTARYGVGANGSGPLTIVPPATAQSAVSTYAVPPHLDTHALAKYEYVLVSERSEKLPGSAADTV